MAYAIDIARKSWTYQSQHCCLSFQSSFWETTRWTSCCFLLDHPLSYHQEGWFSRFHHSSLHSYFSWRGNIQCNAFTMGRIMVIEDTDIVYFIGWRLLWFDCQGISPRQDEQAHCQLEGWWHSWNEGPYSQVQLGGEQGWKCWYDCWWHWYHSHGKSFVAEMLDDLKLCMDDVLIHILFLSLSLYLAPNHSQGLR